MTASAQGTELDFFVSYTARDREWAEWIAWQLHAAGFTIAMQAWHIHAGDDFIQKMDEFIARSRATVLVLSAATLGSPWVRREVSSSIAKDPSGLRRTLIPVRVEACDPTGLLGAIVYADLVGLGETDARESLLAAVQGAGAVAVVPPRPPQPESPPLPRPVAASAIADVQSIAESEPSPAGLRKRLRSTFDGVEFSAFCHDEFPRVYERFAPGITVDQMHTLLLDHCRRNGTLGLLAQLLDQETRS